MKPYTPEPGRPPAKAIDYLRQINREADAGELAPIMGIARRQVSGMMKNAQKYGTVQVRVEVIPGVGRAAHYSALSGEALAEAMAKAHAERERIAAEGKSVRRPNVARDVWQYAAGMP